MHAFPYLLTPLPAINCRGFSGAGVPWELRRLESEYTWDWSELNHGVSRGVLDVFQPWEKVGLVTLVVCTECPKNVANLLIGALHLSIRLRVIARSETQRGSQLFHKAFPNSGSELHSLVTNYVFWNAKASKHMVKKEFCCFKGCR